MLHKNDLFARKGCIYKIIFHGKIWYALERLSAGENSAYVYTKIGFFLFKFLGSVKAKNISQRKFYFCIDKREEEESSIRWYMQGSAIKTGQKYQNRSNIYIVAKDRFSDNILTFLVLSSIIYL